MTPTQRYVVGVGIVSALATTTGALVPAARPGVWLALAASVVVQGPLGWWVVKSLGTDQLIRVWGLGIGARLALLALIGAVVVPALEWPLGPTLVSLAALLGAMLVVEGVVLWLAQPAVEVR